MCIKKATNGSSPFFGGRERALRRYINCPHELLTGFYIAIAFSSVWMHVFCSYSCAVNRKMVPKATTCVFLGYAQSGYRCYDVKSKRLDVSLMLSLMEITKPHIFLNLMFQPLQCSLQVFHSLGENDDKDVLRPSPVHKLFPHSSAVDVTDQLHRPDNRQKMLGKAASWYS